MKKFLYIGMTMLILMIVYIFVGLSHPEYSLPFSLILTYILYFIYIVIMIMMFILYFKNRNK
ncbi:hypothetical protein [Miniphocaeibacter halophilus]|uniref:Uncharacterized protein n=1 Tax=Miniphocaeibacter halophilus TaxID=2931922 RepID=A0AC61MR29_9FIRM|nr:hypothetical protein [Miniphocaeibacter halophilus]QQK08052.1 hypothetical protein JFY71_00510 [Miniphocaeibacter halophilus]